MPRPPAVACVVVVTLFAAGCGAGDVARQAGVPLPQSIKTLTTNQTNCSAVQDAVHQNGQDPNADKIYTVDCTTMDAEFAHDVLTACRANPDSPENAGRFVLRGQRPGTVSPLGCQKVLAFAAKNHIP